MPFTGDLSKLGQLQRNLGKLAAVPSRAAADASDRIASLIDEEFENEADPYGKAWEPLDLSTIMRKGGDDEILHRGGDLRNNVDVHPGSGAGVEIALEDYAGFHQGGTKNMPARPVLPGGTMPATWNDELKQACENQFESLMGAS